VVDFVQNSYRNSFTIGRKKKKKTLFREEDEPLRAAAGVGIVGALAGGWCTVVNFFFYQ